MKHSPKWLKFLIRRSFGRSLPWIMLAFLLLSLAKPAIASAEQYKKVLILHTMREDSWLQVTGDAVLIKSLREGLNGRLDYYIEYIDVARFPDLEYQAALRDFLHRKYAGQRFDLIITVLRTALDFATRYRAELFPDTPVFFIAGGVSDIENAAPGPNFTGVLYRVELNPSVDVALKLQPGLKQIYVISGSSTYDKGYGSAARQQFQQFESRVAFTYLSMLPLEEVKKAVTNLPADSAIYYLTMTEDGAGNRLLPDDVIPPIAAMANAPIYGFNDLSMGRGILGGSLVSFESAFSQAAPVALRILRGERTEDIPVTEIDPKVLMFDWRQLQRFGINEDRLPPGSVVQFREPSFWVQYKWPLIAAFALYVVAAALIAALLVERRKRRRATLKLGESEERFRQLAENIGAVFFIAEGGRENRPGLVLYVSPAYEKTWGRSCQSLYSDANSWLDAVHSKDLERVEASLRGIANREVDEEFRIVRPDGEVRCVHYQHFPIYNERREVYRHAGIIEDITERKQAEWELQRLTARLLTLQDDERRRIARELHDVTAQNLFAITLNLSEIQDRNGELPNKVSNTLKQCQSLTRQSLEEIRTLSYLLHPPLLDHAGLVSALRWYIEGFTKRSGIYASLVTAQDIGRFPSEVETVLFRVVQECLTNIYRHSGSETAEIRLERSGGEVKLIVKDEGRGMGKVDLRVGTNDAQALGVGISGMQQRLRQLGGRLKIESNGGGTIVIAIVPLREESHANSIGR